MKAIFFDLDGTLLDTLGDIGNACNHVLAKYNYPAHPIAAYRNMVGNGFSVLVQRALPPVERTNDALVMQLVEEAREYYRMHMMDLTVPYPGMIESLNALQNSGCYLSVLSNKPDALSKILVQHFFPQISFRFIQGALPDIPLKPNPQSLRQMISELGVSPCCYVGDSDVDMLTARNARITPIGVGWGFRGAEELRENGAFIVLSAPAGLVTLQTLSI